MSHKVLVYTDASFKNGFGGWSAIILYKGKLELIEGKSAHYISDSGACEFYAVLKAIIYIRDNYKQVSTVSINTDHFGIVSSFKRYYRGEEIIGKQTTRFIRKMIFKIAKNSNLFLNAHHVKGHQKMYTNRNLKTLQSIKNGDGLTHLIPAITQKKKKENLFKNLNYVELRKTGTNRSSILNNIADYYSKKNRRKNERSSARAISA